MVVAAKRKLIPNEAQRKLPPAASCVLSAVAYNAAPLIPKKDPTVAKQPCKCNAAPKKSSPTALALYFNQKRAFERDGVLLIENTDLSNIQKFVC